MLHPTSDISSRVSARYDVLKRGNPNAVKPKPFVNADTATLIDHCEKRHPAGWASLRNPPEYEETME